MTYPTVEAYLEKNNTVRFPSNFSYPKKKVKILVTFVDTDYTIDHGLHQIPKDKVTDEMRDLSNKTLKKDKSLFSNI